jgi:hypothetical protein
MKRENKPNTAQPANETVTNQVPSKEELKDSLLDIYDLVKMFNVKRVTIYNWCLNGTLQFIQVGGRRYFKVKDVDKMLEERKQVMVPVEKKQKRK